MGVTQSRQITTYEIYLQPWFRERIDEAWSSFKSKDKQSDDKKDKDEVKQDNEE